MSRRVGYLARFWRLIRPGRNPLARRWDRIEAAVLIGMMLVALLAFPVAAVVGSHTYANQLAASAAQLTDRHPATATLLEDAPAPLATNDSASVDGGAGEAQARWVVNGSVERVGSIATHPGDRAGARVPIWLTNSGELAPPPMTSADALTNGVLVATLVWACVAMTLTALFRIARWLLDRRRAAQWDQEWAVVGGHWSRS